MTKNKPLCVLCDLRATTRAIVEGVDHPVCAWHADWLARQVERASKDAKWREAVRRCSDRLKCFSS